MAAIESAKLLIGHNFPINKQNTSIRFWPQFTLIHGDNNEQERINDCIRGSSSPQ